MFCCYFFHTFAPIFQFKLCRLHDEGAQGYFLPQGAKDPSYATALHVVPAQCLGYAAKKIVVLEYWVQLLFNFMLVSVRQV